MKILLKKGADPFCICNRGNTPLLIAAYHGSLATVKVLLEFFDEKGTPFEQIKEMIEAAARSTCCPKVARLLWHWYWPKVHPCRKDTMDQK